MQPIQHQLTQPVEHMQVEEIEYNQPPPLTCHRQPKQIIHSLWHPIEQMQVGKIEYNHAHAIPGDTDSLLETCAMGSDNLKEKGSRG